MHQAQPLPACQIYRVEPTEAGLVVYARPISDASPCPDCHCSSRRVHSNYTRYPKNLPSAEEPVRLCLQVRRFRWHLIQNARQMLERYLTTVHSRLRRLPTPSATLGSSAGRTRAFPRAKADLHVTHEARQRRLAQYQAVQTLRAQGMGIAPIARKLGLNRQTVRTFAYAQTFPERTRPAPRPSILDPFVPYLESRWREGCENASQRWREIRVKGYRGHHRQVRRWLQHQRRVPSRFGPQRHVNLEAPSAMTEVGARASPLPGARRLAWLLIQDPIGMPAEEAGVVLRVRQDPEVQDVQDQGMAFISMVRNKSGAGFKAWLAGCRQSPVRAIRTFGKGLELDYDAVRAALEGSWSNAQCEGQVTRLKLIKRQMYGRAKFDLLRRRVLLAA